MGAGERLEARSRPRSWTPRRRCAERGRSSSPRRRARSRPGVGLVRTPAPRRPVLIAAPSRARRPKGLDARRRARRRAGKDVHPRRLVAWIPARRRSPRSHNAPSALSHELLDSAAAAIARSRRRRRLGPMISGRRRRPSSSPPPWTSIATLLLARADRKTVIMSARPADLASDPRRWWRGLGGGGRRVATWDIESPSSSTQTRPPPRRARGDVPSRTHTHTHVRGTLMSTAPSSCRLADDLGPDVRSSCFGGGDGAGACGGAGTIRG